MIDINEHVSFWREGAQEDWTVAQELLVHGRTRHGLFLAHLALEKALKAHVCRATQEIAPRIHNLVRLAELTGLSLSQEHLDTLAEMNAFNIEGRYPDMLMSQATPSEAATYFERAREVFEWLMRRL